MSRCDPALPGNKGINAEGDLMKKTLKTLKKEGNSWNIPLLGCPAKTGYLALVKRLDWKEQNICPKSLINISLI
jgi:hypothetical protein